MGLNDRVSAERIHIGFFGLRNAGKSSLVNAVTGQNLSVVSPVLGTTTDPVQKAMELLPLGPVVIIDTPGIDDDDGQLGRLRVQRAKQALDKTDIAVLVADAREGLQAAELALCKRFRELEIPYIVALNKCDLLQGTHTPAEGCLYVSAKTGVHIQELKEQLGRLAGQGPEPRQLVGDLVEAGDLVVLVTPIDESAPKGRMILPQQQMIRDVLDNGGVNLVVQPGQLETALTSLHQRPKLVITDSQAFGAVSAMVPEDIALTSFSILFARYKGELETLVLGAAALDRLQDGDRVLISEGCTHHRQCNDIGTVKLPAWLGKYTGKKLQFDFISGGDFPETLSTYRLVIHCGGCMLSPRQMRARLVQARGEAVPMTNYGIAIAQMHASRRCWKIRNKANQ